MKGMRPRFETMSREEAQTYLDAALEEIHVCAECNDFDEAAEIAKSTVVPVLLRLEELRKTDPDLDRAYEDLIDRYLMEGRPCLGD